MRLRVLRRNLLLVLLLGFFLAPFCARGQTPHKPQGTKDEPHWAFQPIKKPDVPAVKDQCWVRNPIDAFVLDQLDSKKLKPAAPAEPRALLRRVYFDLIGLPPTPEAQRAFLDDKSPNALEKVVDDLLSRPQYGERWARHWLDVARYAESNGYERDGAKPSAWRYRDYVINALNNDKPFDRFVTEQIAGDEIEESSAETRIATSFLRLGTWDDEPADPKVDRYDQLDDVLGTTATAFLGLTLRCARCHNHKFEPLTQKDYYRMLAVFEPLKRPRNERDELDWPVGTRAELQAYREESARADAVAAPLMTKLEEIRGPIRTHLLAEPGPDPPGVKRTHLPLDAAAAFRVKPTKRTEAQMALVEKHNKALLDEIRTQETTEQRAQDEELDKAIAAIDCTRPKELPHAYTWNEDSPKAPVTHVLKRGNPEKPAEAVEPGLPAVLVREQPPPPATTAKTTGRRLWLARWITSPDNPLTARVIVNRVWQHHFGEGIVATPNDFGRMGEPPVHQALLDWLAADFVEHGWSLKRLHRMILLSNTFHMAATPSSGPGSLPLGCRQRRLEAEPIRDAMLMVSGGLNAQRGGPSVYPPVPRAVLEGQSRPGDGWGKSDERQAARRSIYIFAKRSLIVPELDLLDAPDTTNSCEARPVSTTGPQALTFLNGEFAHRQARAFAERLQKEAGSDAKVQVSRAFTLALCRPPTDEESKAALEFLDKQKKQIGADAAKAGRNTDHAERKALEALCLVILNTNEFVYAD
jgi:hypothetical protein